MNELQRHVRTWMNLTKIMLSEKQKTQTVTEYDSIYMKLQWQANYTILLRDACMNGLRKKQENDRGGRKRFGERFLVCWSC